MAVAYTEAMRSDLRNIALVLSDVLAPYDVREAYLFGSFARGEESDASDIDLRLVCGPSMTYGVLYEISQKLESALGRTVEIVTNPPEYMRPRFRENIQKDEVLLYEAA